MPAPTFKLSPFLFAFLDFVNFSHILKGGVCLDSGPSVFRTKGS